MNENKNEQVLANAESSIYNVDVSDKWDYSNEKKQMLTVVLVDGVVVDVDGV